MWGTCYCLSEMPESMCYHRDFLLFGDARSVQDPSNANDSLSIGGFTLRSDVMLHSDSSGGSFTNVRQKERRPGPYRVGIVQCHCPRPNAIAVGTQICPIPGRGIYNGSASYHHAILLFLDPYLASFSQLAAKHGTISNKAAVGNCLQSHSGSKNTVGRKVAFHAWTWLPENPISVMMHAILWMKYTDLLDILFPAYLDCVCLAKGFPY